MRARAKYFLAAAVVAAIGGARPAAAGYPDHPVKIIAPFTAGGPTDLTARLLAEPEAAVLCRRPPRRRRQYRDAASRALRAGRLHAPGGKLELRGQSKPLRQQAVRSVQGFYAGVARRSGTEYPGRAPF